MRANGFVVFCMLAFGTGSATAVSRCAVDRVERFDSSFRVFLIESDRYSDLGVKRRLSPRWTSVPLEGSPPFFDLEEGDLVTRRIVRHANCSYEVESIDGIVGVRATFRFDSLGAHSKESEFIIPVQRP